MYVHICIYIFIYIYTAPLEVPAQGPERTHVGHYSNPYIYIYVYTHTYIYTLVYIHIREYIHTQGTFGDGRAKGLKGRVLGIIGFGRIGRRVAMLAQAFGMHVVAWSHSGGKNSQMSAP